MTSSVKLMRQAVTAIEKLQQRHEDEIYEFDGVLNALDAIACTLDICGEPVSYYGRKYRVVRAVTYPAKLLFRRVRNVVYR